MAILDRPEETQDVEMSFIDHLEALRWHILRSAVAVLVLSIAAFVNKDFIFNDVFMGPGRPDFWTFRQLCKLSHLMGLGKDLCVEKINYELLNTEVGGQFVQHISIALTTGVVLAFPYAAWELWRFFKPALTSREKNYTRGVVFASSILFFIGILFGYYLVTPITLQFLLNYELSKAIANMPTISNYISIVTMTTVSIALVFELPIVIYFLSKGGMVTPAFMRRHRKHAFVIILILAAVLTPSTDILSQMLVAVPFIGLYEVSILVSQSVNRKNLEN